MCQWNNFFFFFLHLVHSRTDRIQLYPGDENKEYHHLAGPDKSRLDWEHYVVFVRKRLQYSHSASLMLGGNPCDGLASHPGGSRNSPSHLMQQKPG